MRRPSTLVAIALLAIALPGCADEKITTVSGHAEWVTSAAPDALDFGPVLVDTRAEAGVTLRNSGMADFRVESVEAPDLPAAFRYRFEPFVVERGGGTRVLPLVFEPRQSGPHSGRLVFKLAGADEAEIALEVLGLGVDDGCQVTPAETLDFGRVKIGDSYVSQVKIANPSDLTWKVRVGAIGGSDADSFTFANFAPGEHSVPAHGELRIPVEFRPNHAGQHRALLELLSPAMCQRTMALVAEGLQEVLECSPKVQVKDASGSERWPCRLDFGFVLPGSQASSQFVLRNLGNADLTLSDFQLVQPGGKGEPYAVELPSGALELPGCGGSLTFPVTFAPSQLGAQPGTLRFSTGSGRFQDGEVELAGIGGGPRIAVVPQKVDFGPIAIGAFLPRRVTLANTGVLVTGAAGEDNLKLGAFEGGTWTEKRPEILSATPGDFELLWPPPGYSAAGLAASKTLELTVRFTPQAPGPRSATLRIYSNDRDQSEVDVALSGIGDSAPPCVFDLAPSRVDFGTIEPGRSKTLPLSIVNRSGTPGEVCTLYSLDLAVGDSNGFSLPKGPLSQVTIAPGERLEVPVRFVARAAGAATGEIVLYTSSTQTPEARVSLNALVQSVCLRVWPDDLDFGVIKLNCSSREQSFTISNVCGSNVSITAIDLEGASAPFRISGRPALPTTLAPSANLQVKVAFRPTAAGDAAALLVVRTAQSLTYVVGLTGRGSTNPIQTDVFAQDARPKVDTLLVIDDSGSMSDHQTRLGTNFESFIKFALAEKVDYHIAVTTTSIGTSSGYANGRFYPLDGTDPRVITSSTPDPKGVFLRNVKVGTNGSGTEILIRPAHLALSEPLLSGHNAGFLREEARLSVVVISDSVDQDQTTLTTYENFLLGLKGYKRRSEVSFSGVIPTLSSAPSWCSYDPDYSAGGSTRVTRLAQSTGGIVEEICTQDWSKSLEALSRNLFGLRTKFFLTNPPESPDAIVVTLDGYEYPQLGPWGDIRWSYESTDTSILFNPLSAPEAGQTIAVTYPVACL